MIVITGATGQVGSKIVAKLLSKGEKVKALGRNQEKLDGLKIQGAIVENVEPNDITALTNAFKGADVVFLILPPNFQAKNIGQFHDEIGEAQIEAIKNANVKNVVFLSSQGASVFEKTGVVAGVGRHEMRLNRLENVNVLSIRPTYFMENTLALIPMIETAGFIGMPIKKDVSLGLIATEDVAEITSKKLTLLDFKGKSHIDLLGDRDYSHIELAGIIGNAFGKPELLYVDFSYDDNKAALLKYGISDSMADYFNTLYKGINDGVFITAKRTPETTTPTSFETFINIVLATATNLKK
jgi:uncharacterized protein YbjT (DUF2867 family)